MNVKDMNIKIIGVKTKGRIKSGIKNPKSGIRNPKLGKACYKPTELKTNFLLKDKIGKCICINEEYNMLKNKIKNYEVIKVYDTYALCRHKKYKYTECFLIEDLKICGVISKCY